MSERLAAMHCKPLEGHAAMSAPQIDASSSEDASF